MNFLKNKKGQILGLTILIILISLGTVLISFMPINQQVIRLRKLLNSFQALAYSESGIEFANYYIHLGDNIGNFDISISTSTFENSQCQNFVNRFDFDFNYCYITIMTTSTQNMKIEIYDSVYIGEGSYSYTKLISSGEFRKVIRIVDFDFRPGNL